MFRGLFKRHKATPTQPESDSADSATPASTPATPPPRIIEFTPQNTESQILHAFTNFLNTDLKITTELLALTPRPENDLDEATRSAYVERLTHALESFHADFNQIDQDFGFDDQTTEDFFRARRGALNVDQYAPGLPQQLFQGEFFGLRPDFTTEVKRRSVGYSLFGTSAILLAGEARTVNEYLYAYHSQIINNEKMLQSIPPLAEREMSDGYTATLRGETSLDAREILESLPASLANDWTDIVAAGGHILVMIRGRAHTLTLDIARTPEQYRVDYHIPQISNQQVAATLPGVMRVTSDGSFGAVGIPYDAKLGEAIAGFISQIPTNIGAEPAKS